MHGRDISTIVFLQLVVFYNRYILKQDKLRIFGLYYKLKQKGHIRIIIIFFVSYISLKSVGLDESNHVWS